jgi:tetratricopeptide (TPR) repeat protein
MITRPLALALAGVLVVELSLLRADSGQAADKDEAWVEVRSPHFIVASNAGEKQARRVANQFEQIRAAFQTVKPGIRVDPGQPIIILAAKNEAALKNLLPEFWERKGHTHPAGIFLAGEEKHYVALRLDVSGDNPYKPIYHEYVHMLVNLNFRRIPLWLDEGFAEFYANTIIGDKEIQMGNPDPAHFALLQHSKLLPLDVLLRVDHDSPYYNEANKASIFYAESWALVHYLLLDERMRQSQPVAHFLGLVQNDVDDLEAARRTFGDLTQLAKTLQEYARRSTFYHVVAKSSAKVSEKDFAARALSPADSLSLRGDFHLRMGRLAEARSLLEEALRSDPNLAVAYESMAFLHYRLGEREEAAKWFAQAVKLDSRSALAHYFHAMLMVQDVQRPEGFPEVEASLRRSIELNPNFAPAYAALAGFYALRDDTLGKAIEAASKAIQLNPSEQAYYLNFARILAHAQRFDDARRIGQRALDAAKSPEARVAAESFLEELTRYQEVTGQRKQYEEQSRATRQETASPPPGDSAGAPPKAESSRATQTSSPAAPKGLSAKLYAATGKIIATTCQDPPAMELTLSLGAVSMRLHAANMFKVGYLTVGWTPPDHFDPCVHLKGLSVQATYHLAYGQPYDAEIVSIEVKK